jgi:hypothetical protein
LFGVFFFNTPTKTPSSAVSRDKSVRRSAQDDVFVVGWRAKNSVFSDFYCLPKQVSAYGTKPQRSLSPHRLANPMSDMKVIQPDRLIPINPVSHFFASTTLSGS